MKRNVKFPKEARLGARAESETKSRLESFSTVTKFQPDLGIDFYCQLIEVDSPSTPFYVQAKGTKQFGDTWSKAIKKSTIRYWLQQMFPVFLVVYDEDTEDCYWASIENRRLDLIRSLFQTRSETMHIRIGKSHILEKKRAKNSEFIGKIKNDLNSIWLSRGYPQPKGRGYVKTILLPQGQRLS